MGHHGPVSNQDPPAPVHDDVTASAPAPDAPDTDAAAPAEPVPASTSDNAAAGDADEEIIEDGALAVPVAPVPGRSRRAGLVAAVALVVTVAFVAGIGVGRVTAPSPGTGGVAAASATPGGSASPDATLPAASTAPGASGAASASADPLASLPSNGPLLGSASAKVQIVYWADYQCPYCSKFAAEVLPLLASRIADGTVSVLHRDFAFLGPESLNAGTAVRCAADEGKYWAMHDAVYAAQNGENRGAFALEKLTPIAASIGLDTAKFEACIGGEDALIALLADTSDGYRAGVESTPTLDVPGRRFTGVPDTAAFLAAVDAAAKAGTAPTAAPSFSAPQGSWAGIPSEGRAAGDASAKVTVELWVDYQSKDMPALVKDLEPELRARAKSGKVHVVIRDLSTMGDESNAAAAFARCAGETGTSAWLVNDALGSSGQGAGAGIFTGRNLLWFGARLGGDVRGISACMLDPATAAAVTADTQAGTSLGLTVAPTVVVKAGSEETGRFEGALDVKKVLAAIDAAAK